MDEIFRESLNTTLRVPVTLSNERIYKKPQGYVEQIFPQLIRTIYRRADSLIAISEGVKRDLIESFDIEPEKVEVIYNPVITDEVYELMNESVSHPFFSTPDPVYIGVGRLTEQKNFSHLIRSFNEVVSRQDAKLIILGKGDREQQLKNLCSELSISDHVSFPGFVDNPYKYMSKSDVFVLSSKWEGFGNVIVEAMACGTQVVATDCESGPAEILENGRYGHLVPVDQVQTLANMMEDALDNPYNDQLLQERASDFHVNKIAPQYESCIFS